MLVRRLRLSAVGLLLLAACSSSPEPSHKGTTPADKPTESATVAHRDPRLGVPTFAWLSRADLPAFASAHEAATSTAVVDRVAQAFELRGDARRSLTDLRIDEAARGPIVARYQQRVGDLEVFRGGVSIAMTRAFEPIAASGFLAPRTETPKPFVLDSAQAVGAAFAVMTGTSMSQALSSVSGAHGYDRFVSPTLARPARAKRVLFPRRSAEDDGVTLDSAYYVELSLVNGPAMSFVVSAENGRVLARNDLTRHDAYTYRVFADPTTLLPMDGPQGNAYAPHPSGTPDKRKPVFVESQPVTLANFPFSKNDPWLPTNATTTRGNNVVAYADIASPTGFNANSDIAPTLTDTAFFGSIYDPNASPKATQDAIRGSATQLFYVTNFLHDWFYDAGYDEASGNHQTDGFGRGGKSGDPLLAEAQDYSGRNNANAQVPADGASPIIQMFVFAGPSNAELDVSAPASIAGKKSVGIASGFGPDSFELSGSVVLAQDGEGADPADACEPLANNVTGKIVLAHRSTCSFAQKAQMAQEAGAIGCIIANVASSVQPTTAPFMGGTANGITIPVLSLSVTDGKPLETAIPEGVTVTMKRSASGDLDGALDTTIVAHEWGHVLSGRLIGDGNGLTTNQAGGLGEGWGDFVALLLMARPDDPDKWGGAYANGSYATSGSGDDIYFGIRRVPYSIDFKKNALTLKHIMNGVALPDDVPTSFGEEGNSNSEVHNTGEVWATMLWECYVALLRDGRFSFTEAQERMKRYLVASLKLTPPDPTVLEARDAVLAAAYAADEKDFKLFWEAFARRGAGAGAVGPDKKSTTNDPVVESYFAGNDIRIESAKVTDDVISCDRDGILDEGEVGTIELVLRNAGSGVVSETTAKPSSKTPGVSFVGGDVKVPTLKPFESTTLKVPVTAHGPKPTEIIELDVTLADPSFAPGRTIAVKVPTYFNADESAQASALDRADAKKTSWKVANDDTLDTEQKWQRITEGGTDTYWSIPNSPWASDNYLTSPKFTIEDTSFSLSFKHRWSFRFSARRAVDQDGGVIEVSVDGGKKWEDISTYGKVDYNSALDAGGRGDNPIKGRKAYGNKNEGYPDKWVNSKIAVTLPSHPESVQIRFRVGTGSNFRGADGWDIDDIELGGITSLPFYAYIPHADACDPQAPTAFAGDGRVAPVGARVTFAGSATSPKDATLTYQWTQVEGPSVTLEGGTTPTPAFVMPDVPAGTVLGFVLRANDGTLLSPASRVDATLEPTAPATDSTQSGGCGCKTMGATASLSDTKALLSYAGVALFALVLRRRRRPDGELRS